MLFKTIRRALAGVAQWIGCWPMNLRVASSSSSQGTKQKVWLLSYFFKNLFSLWIVPNIASAFLAYSIGNTQRVYCLSPNELKGWVFLSFPNALRKTFKPPRMFFWYKDISKWAWFPDFDVCIMWLCVSLFLGNTHWYV